MRSSVSQPSNKIQDHSQAPNPQTEMWHEEVAEIQPQVPEGGQDPQQGAEAHNVREDVHPCPAREISPKAAWASRLSGDYLVE